MKALLSRHDMTVTSVIGPRGEIWQLDAHVAVKAGQWLYCGTRLDGTPVVSVATDTPTFDRVGWEQNCQGPEILGIVTIEPGALGPGCFPGADTVDEDEDAFDVIYRVVVGTSGFFSSTVDRREQIPA